MKNQADLLRLPEGPGVQGRPLPPATRPWTGLATPPKSAFLQRLNSGEFLDLTG
jgi:hypothetical protein